MQLHGGMVPRYGPGAGAGVGAGVGDGDVVDLKVCDSQSGFFPRWLEEVRKVGCEVL